jgi:hypothetical protein
LAAARNGARVVLCQDRPVLGGNASSEVRMHIVGATGLKGGVPLESELREGGIIEEIRLDVAVQNPQRSPSMMDLVLYDKCRREPNLTLLLNTTVDGAEVVDGLIRSVTATRPSTEDRFRIEASVFVDCTGDGRLGLEAGAPYRHGREAGSEFHESLAPAEADRKTLGSTILFQARKHDRPMPFVPPPWARQFCANDFRLRPFGKPGSDLGLEYGYWWAEWGGCLDTIKDNERIRDELLAIILGIWNFIKNESGQDTSHWALEWFGFLPGKRESRRFVGRYTLTEHDVFHSTSFPDAIAYGGWPVDMHPPEGVDASHLPPCEQYHLPHLYDIPLRACVSSHLANLMFAGRNISATHAAFASTRVMATCAVVGQGVGTAAARAVHERLWPAEIVNRPDVMQAIQQRLLRDDAYLVGIRNQDPADLVLQAQAIRASSAQPGADAEQIRSGQTRSIHGKPTEPTDSHGDSQGKNLWESALRDQPSAEKRPAAVTCAPPDRAFPGLHRWMSAPAEGLPAWLEIRWEHPVRWQEIVLIFDTGLHRHLTLSQADGYTATMQWGRPQEETVRAYQLQVQQDTDWRTIFEVHDNYQRQRSHRFAKPIETCGVRIIILATHGLDHARMLEVRCYE